MKLLVRLAFLVSTLAITSVFAQPTYETFTQITCVKHSGTWTSQSSVANGDAYCRDAAQKISLGKKTTKFTLCIGTQKQSEGMGAQKQSGATPEEGPIKGLSCNNNSDCANIWCPHTLPFTAAHKICALSHVCICLTEIN